MLIQTTNFEKRQELNVFEGTELVASLPLAIKYFRFSQVH